VDAGCKSLISICFSKIAGAPIGSPQFLGSKEESMACALRRYGVTDSGLSNDGDEHLCLDTSNLNDQSPVIAWDVPASLISRKQSDRFGKYFLQDIKDFID
jgi:hypothetical protein